MRKSLSIERLFLYIESKINNKKCAAMNQLNQQSALEPVESVLEPQAIVQVEQQEQQPQSSTSDWSGGLDVAGIALDVLDVVGDLVKKIDLNL